MDQNPLVTDQIDEGQRIIDACASAGVDVAAAFWLRPSEDGAWYFYLATRIVEDDSISAAFKAVLRAMRALNPPANLDPLGDLKVIGASNPITREVLEVLARYPARLGTRYQGRRLGAISITGAYLYPFQEAVA